MIIFTVAFFLLCYCTYYALGLRDKMSSRSQNTDKILHFFGGSVKVVRTLVHC